MCSKLKGISLPPASQSTCTCRHVQCCALPTWWSWRGGCTRSHSEHGRETPQRRWYFVLRRGRVGRCQVCKAQQNLLTYENWNTHGSLSRPVLPFALQKTRKACRGVEQPRSNRRGKASRFGKAYKTGHARKLKSYRGVEQPGSSSGS